MHSRNAITQHGSIRRTCHQDNVSNYSRILHLLLCDYRRNDYTPIRHEMLCQRRRCHSNKSTSCVGWKLLRLLLRWCLLPSTGLQDPLLVEHEQSMVAIVGFSGLDVRQSDLRAAKN